MHGCVIIQLINRGAKSIYYKVLAIISRMIRPLLASKFFYPLASIENYDVRFLVLLILGININNKLRYFPLLKWLGQDILKVNGSV